MGYFNVIKTCKRSTRSNQLQMKAGILCSATEMIIYSNSVFFDIVAVLKLLSEKNRDCLMSSYFCLLSLHWRASLALQKLSKIMKNCISRSIWNFQTIESSMHLSVWEAVSNGSYRCIIIFPGSLLKLVVAGWTACQGCQ